MPELNIDYLAAVEGERLEWQDPRINPPPPGIKIQCLTRGGISITGHWSDTYLAWHKLAKQPKWLKDRLSEAYLSPKNKTN
jgi:hypothetical protein